MRTYIATVALVLLGAANLSLANTSELPSEASSGRVQSPIVVRLYATAECGKECEAVKRQLQATQIAFEEIALSESTSEATLERFRKLNSKLVPVVTIGDAVIVAPGRIELKANLAKQFGEKILSSLEKQYLGRHFSSSGEPKIVMYSAAWCGYCAKLRDELKSSGTPFTEIDADASPDKAELKRVIGITGYPTVYVGDKRMRSRTIANLRRAISL